MTHQVRLAGRTTAFDVADGETVLQAGLRNHLALPFGCQSGSCASCRVRKLEGEVAYAFEPPALSAAEIEAGYILMCLAQARSDLVIDLHQPPQIESLRPRQLPCRVQSKTWLAHDVLGLSLKLPKNSDFTWLPGQYIDLLLDDGRRRSFSIANAPGRGMLELHVRVAPGGRFAHWAAHEMPERAILRFEGPLGAFYLRDESTRPVVMVAGGTGIAPIHAMLEALTAGTHTRPVRLYWGVRAQRDLYIHERLLRWAREHDWLRYVPVLSDADDGWDGARGLVHEAALHDQPDLHDVEAYLSGPPVMVRAGKQAFAAAGLDADHLFYDSFDYAHETWPAVG
ncbi:2Fe-2S iron-sulfur cluster-binding protein [Sinimarinibacterium flocculans]|uniref:CDP-4-dehydro-6-deoxyglucose reductase n=1 Tax=Sinimarinibacterium flocculans TaxID=985250 RepID=A0A318EC60_9GAMM|nr:2Fe-2S iron-sulfur cluster-binding protein [Sinimarinibacterium flocculans]PXV65194.1 CDP-4-dehydro-6-deoxyglucose reductase [Sinimarinibacterium flocculans]